MNKYKLTTLIEQFAPLNTQEKWDNSGWQVELDNIEISRVMIALTVTEDVYNQAKDLNCDMILAHHPLFEIPLKYSDINIYSAHTNMDKTIGGTTDTLIKNLEFEVCQSTEFLRVCKKNISIEDLLKNLKNISNNIRIINNKNQKEVSKIAFCAGSGMDLYNDVIDLGCDCFITGDIKYHNAIDSDILLIDIGHFESEILIKKVFQGLIEKYVEVYIANEKSPFKNI